MQTEKVPVKLTNREIQLAILAELQAIREAQTVRSDAALVRMLGQSSAIGLKVINEVAAAQEAQKEFQ